MIDLKKGGCLKLMDDIPDHSIDMILCDLPYGTTKCRWDTIIPFDELWLQYKRVIKDKGAIVLFGTEPFTSKLILSNVNEFREKLTWIKHRASNFMAAKTKHLKYTEDLVVFGNGKVTYNKQKVARESPRVKEMQNHNCIRKGSPSIVSNGSYLKPISYKKYSPDFKNPTDYLKFPAIANNSKEKTKHPTQKPVALLEYLVKTYSNKGETVLDNCMGSGSTGVACVNLGRSFIGMELDDEYFEIAQKRIDEASKESAYA